MYDIVIRHGTVFDGTGADGVSADVALDGDAIVAVGEVLNRGEVEIDATGLAVAPGFIDIHSHSDLSLMWDGLGQSKLRQGVTTEVVGNCSLSPAPVTAELRQEMAEAFQYIWADVPWTWLSMGEYLDALQASRPAIHVAAQVGHSALRACVLGFEDRRADESDLRALCNLLRKSLDEGACGLSSGLIYAPSVYADEPEFHALGKVLAERGKYYSSHMRGEGATLMDSLDETIRVGEVSDVRVQIVHLKSAGKPYWGNAGRALEKIQRAADAGAEIGFDVYPYTAGSTHLSALVSPWAHEGGTAALLGRLADPSLRARLKEEQVNGYPEWQSFIGKGSWDPAGIVLASVGTEENQRLVGKSLQQIADERGVDARDATYDLIVEEENQVSCVAHLIGEEDVELILRHPLGSVGSDGLAICPKEPFARSKPHPRSYGTFPRVLSRYVRQRATLTLPEALRKMTSLPATQAGLKTKGQLTTGYDADVVVFDPATVHDEATFEDPHRYPSGIPWVIVNGRAAVSNGEVTGERNGRVLR